MNNAAAFRETDTERQRSRQPAGSAAISVIIPVYGVEACLRACVDSVLRQTFADFECILVDDGSADACPAICDAYARQDDRVRVIHQQNSGLSAARNTGIAAAKGAYISFIDADDAVHPDFLKTLYRALRDENAEIAACGYERFADGASFPEGRPSGGRTCWDQKEAILELTRTGEDRRGEFVSVVWNKLYVRRLFDRVRYPVGKWHEDEFAILPLLLQCGRVVKCEAALYFYRQREDSITGGAREADIRHLDALDAFRQRCELLRAPEYRDIYSTVVSHYFEMMLYLAYQVAKPAGIFRAYHRRYLREMLRYGPWVRGKRFFVFALCPRAYEKKHGL